VTDISESLPKRFPGNPDAWFNPVTPAPGIAVCGVHSTKAFEYVELANSYPLE